jgi:hypothetical protein
VHIGDTSTHLTHSTETGPTPVTYRLPTALQDDDDAKAVEVLQRYFGRSGGSRFTGSFFDGWAQPQDPYRFTADDFVAVSFLTVFVPPLAARQVLEQQIDLFSELLHDVGPDRDLVEEEGSIDPGWPGWRLQTELRKLPDVGRTIASKLCARKRPRLLPIYDLHIGVVTNARKEQWVPLRDALQANGGALHERLLRLHRLADLPPEVSPLRVHDVIAWMQGSGN